MTRGLLVGGVLAAGVAAAPGQAYTRPGTTHMVSVSVSNGDLKDPKNKPWTNQPVVTSDGRFVAFVSAAKDLVPESESPIGVLAKTVDVRTVYVHDDKLRTNTVVTVRTDGRLVLCPIGSTTSCTLGDHPSISDDGRFVAFESNSPNLVDLDTNLGTDIFVRDLKLKTTTRVSVDSKGVQADHESSWPSISADGRYVAFQSNATNLVTGDTNGATDVFVHDMKTGSTVRASVSTAGEQAGASTVPGIGVLPLVGGSSYSVIPEISRTGRYVVFLSAAGNLAPGDTNNKNDVYLRDLVGHTTTLMSLSSDGTISNNNSGGRLGVSQDGRYVSFVSLGTNLIPNDTNDDDDVFVRDRLRNRTTRISVTSSGQEGSRLLNPNVPLLTSGAPAYDSSMSWSGRLVSFWSVGSDFGTTSTGVPAVADHTFVYDVQAGAVVMATVSSTGKPAVDDGPCSTTAGAPCAYAGAGFLGGSGRYISFTSTATNLDSRHSRSATTPDTNRVYVRDLGSPMAVGSLGKAATGSSPALGQSTRAGELPQAGGLIGAELLSRPALHDLFGRVELGDLPRAGGPLVGLTLDVAGTRYQVRARPTGALAVSRTGGATFGLYRAETDGTWTWVAELDGGYGTTGSEVVFALPLSLLGAASASGIRGIEAFSALDASGLAPSATLARLRLR